MNSHAKEINQYLRSLKPDWNVNLPHFNQFIIDKETQILLWSISSASVTTNVFTILKSYLGRTKIQWEYAVSLN
ncbi:MAG TPA: hypothetical protein PKD32_07475 [Saprospiraceae bacterium]|nr:hypothetical protein [Saprospiraceae bacterium]